MVKKFALFLFYAIFFVMAVIYFLPKKEIFYAFEQELQKHHITIEAKEVEETSFGLQCKDVDIAFKGIKALHLQTLQINFYALFATINAEKITLDSMLENFVPTHIAVMQLQWGVHNPVVLQAEAVGDFGTANATLQLLKQQISLHVKPSNVMLHKHRKTLQKLRKTNDGEYMYEHAL
jgi:hypothetical protein